MYIGYNENVPHMKPSKTSKMKVECYKCDYWCEYEYDPDWELYFSQSPKKPFWFFAKGHTGMAACFDCGTIYCERHSKGSTTMICPECGSTGARKAIFQVLEDGN